MSKTRWERNVRSLRMRKVVETGMALRVRTRRKRGAATWRKVKSVGALSKPLAVKRWKVTSPPYSHQLKKEVASNKPATKHHNVHADLSRLAARKVPRVCMLSLAITE